MHWHQVSTQTIAKKRDLFTRWGKLEQHSWKWIQQIVDISKTPFRKYSCQHFFWMLRNYSKQQHQINYYLFQKAPQVFQDSLSNRWKHLDISAKSIISYPLSFTAFSRLNNEIWQAALQVQDQLICQFHQILLI